MQPDSGPRTESGRRSPRISDPETDRGVFPISTLACVAFVLGTRLFPERTIPSLRGYPDFAHHSIDRLFLLTADCILPGCLFDWRPPRSAQRGAADGRPSPNPPLSIGSPCSLQPVGALG